MYTHIQEATKVTGYIKTKEMRFGFLKYIYISFTILSFFCVTYSSILAFHHFVFLILFSFFSSFFDNLCFANSELTGFPFFWVTWEFDQLNTLCL